MTTADLRFSFEMRCQKLVRRFTDAARRRCLASVVLLAFLLMSLVLPAASATPPVEVSVLSQHFYADEPLTLRVVAAANTSFDFRVSDAYGNIVAGQLKLVVPLGNVSATQFFLHAAGLFNLTVSFEDGTHRSVIFALNPQAPTGEDLARLWLKVFETLKDATAIVDTLAAKGDFAIGFAAITFLTALGAFVWARGETKKSKLTSFEKSVEEMTKVMRLEAKR